MDRGFWNWNSYLSRAVFRQVFAVDVGHYEAFSCHFHCYFGNLSCQKSSQRACVKRAGSKGLEFRCKRSHVYLCNDIWHFVDSDSGAQTGIGHKTAKKHPAA